MKNKICEYGCENEANFETKAGRACCSKSAASCPAVRKKNSDAIKAAHAEGRLKGWNAQENLDRGWAKGKNHLSDSRIKCMWTFEMVFCEASSAHRALVKQYLVEMGRGKTCEICNIDTWQNQPIVLELDHINGVRDDNRIENLRFLCPNCHSQTSTYRSKNSNKLRLLKGDVANYVKQPRGREWSNDEISFLRNLCAENAHTKLSKIKQEKKQTPHRTYAEIYALHKECVEKLRSSNIDVTMWGWTVKAAQIIDLPSQHIRHWMKIWCPELLQNARTRNRY